MQIVITYTKSSKENALKKLGKQLQVNENPKVTHLEDKAQERRFTDENTQQALSLIISEMAPILNSKYL